ncbi:MAG: alpha/beta hydrolase [Lachnospiraceae bacterium]|nr:alpha/beta hydrolase [Lachnospiraceae bacterium]
MEKNQEYFLNCDGIDIHIKLDLPDTKNKKMPLLIVIPGLTGHMEEEHIIAVADAAREIGFASLRAEMYGHGKSGGVFYDHTVMHWMLEIMRVIDHAASLPFVTDLYLCGHSQGGLAVVLAAGLKADAIKALIPLSPAMNIWDGAKKGSLFDGEFDPENLPAEFEQDDWKVSANYLRAARMLPVEEAVGFYHGPVLIVHGTEDESVPYRYGASLAEKYEHAKLITIENEDHCYTRHLTRVTDAVKKFLVEIGG